MKQTLLLFMGLCLTLFLGLLQEASAQQDWQPVLSQEGVQVFSRELHNVPSTKTSAYSDFILLRFENNNDFSVELSWHLELYHADGCFGCQSQSGEFERHIRLEAGEVFEVKKTGSYDLQARQLRITKRYSRSARVLTSFTLRDFFVDYEDK